MNTKTIFNIKLDKELKKNAQETAKELGIPLSTAVQAFLRQFVRDKELTISYKPSKYLKKILKDAEQELKDKKDHGPFENLDNLMRSLDA